MIRLEHLDRFLLVAMPDLRPMWPGVIETMRLNDGTRARYSEMAHIARHLVDLERAGRHDTLRSVFAVIERMVRSDDPEVANLAVVGILEGLLFGCTYEDEPAYHLRFEPFIGTQTQRSWDELSAWINSGRLP